MTVDFDQAYSESNQRRNRRVRRRRLNFVLLSILSICALACCSGIVLNFAHSFNSAKPLATMPVGTFGASRPAAMVSPKLAQTSLKNLLSLKGSGIRKSENFETPAEWRLQYSFDCSKSGTDGNFIVMSYNNGGEGMDILVNALNRKGSDNIPVHNSPGRHYLEIDSACSWNVTVMG